jgi:hypothetical protein
VLREEIRRCAFFVPILSKNVLTDEAAFFVREWKWAIDVSRDFTRPFIIPCAIDDVARDDRRLLSEIRELHIESIQTDAALEAFADHLRQLFRQYRLGDDAL